MKNGVPALPQGTNSRMQCTPLPRQPSRETSGRRAERGTESKEAEAYLAGYSRRVTPLAFILGYLFGFCLNRDRGS